MVLDFLNAAPTQAQEDAARAVLGPTCLFKWSQFDHTVRVQWVDHPGPVGGIPPGQIDTEFYAYTTIGAGPTPTLDVQLRNTLGLGPDAEGDFYKLSRYPPNTLNFITECMVHELGHIVVGYIPDADVLFPPLFYLNGRQGTAADWQPHDRHEYLQIVEATVETFKDAYYPSRATDSFSFWRMPRGNFAAFIRLFPQPGEDLTPYPKWHITFFAPGGET
ncbi:MAG: hypothetical protein QOF36_2530 [Microbacteriaceae bacterium]|nr:hypothetical protein [Microbacteriaceae bacterium]